MALKGSFIGYTNAAGANRVLTITGASLVRLSSTSALEYYTTSQLVGNAQTIPANTLFELSCHGSKQQNSDTFEDIHIIVANGENVTGFVAGTSVEWSVAAP